MKESLMLSIAENQILEQIEKEKVVILDTEEEINGLSFDNDSGKWLVAKKEDKVILAHYPKNEKVAKTSRIFTEETAVAIISMLSIAIGEMNLIDMDAEKE